MLFSPLSFALMTRTSAPPRVPSSSRLARCVREMLLWRSDFDASGILVDVDGGVVTLSGHVAHPDHAREAVRLARSIVDVREVRDRLTVLV